MQKKYFNLLLCLPYIKMVLSTPLYILRGDRSEFSNDDVFISLKILFTFTNSADPDEMPY